jgi:hypothetical protein
MLKIRKHSTCSPEEAFKTWNVEHRMRALSALGSVLVCIASGTALFYFYETVSLDDPTQPPPPGFISYSCHLVLNAALLVFFLVL